MADVLADLKNWSSTASSNLPSGATSIGTGLDDNLRQLQATVRQDLASVGANIASAGTCDLGAVAGLFHTITGTTTITSFGTVAAGIWKVLTFNGALTITHNGTSLICPYGANITTTANDTLLAESLGSGNWKIHPFHVATLYAALAGATFTGAVAFPDGSASTPSITHAGDLNCGFFFPAADTMAGATAGVERWRFNPNGQFGIGVTPNAGWGASVPAVQLSTLTSIYQNSGISGFVNNGYHNGTNLKLSTATSASGVFLSASYAIMKIYYTGAADSTVSELSSFGLDGSGNATMTTATGGIGYGTGAGGAVTQGTSRTTGVTLSKPCGAITLFSAAGSSSYTTFTVTNSLVGANDIVHCRKISGTDDYGIHTQTVTGGGGFRINFIDLTGTTTEQPIFEFYVEKAVAA